MALIRRKTGKMFHDIFKDPVFMEWCNIIRWYFRFYFTTRYFIGISRQQPL
jgi:hypothetical protein